MNRRKFDDNQALQQHMRMATRQIGKASKLVTTMLPLAVFGLLVSACGTKVAGGPASPTPTSSTPASSRSSSLPTSSSSSSNLTARITMFANPSPDVLWVRLATNQVYYSSDGGKSWIDRTPSNWTRPTRYVSPPAAGALPATTTKNITAMANVTSNGIVQIATSVNDGQEWQTTNLPKTFSPGVGPVGVSFVNASDGWASVNLPSGSAFAFTDVFQTNDGGKTWSFETQINGAAGPVEFITPTIGFAAGAPAAHPLFGTTDGGKTWHALSLPIPSGDVAENITGAPIFIDSHDGFVYVYFEKTLGQNPLLPYMDITTDGGQTWSQMSLPLVNGNVSAWSIVSANDWFLVGPHLVMHTTDGGKSWTSVTPNRTLTNLQAAVFTSDSDGVAEIDTTTCPDRSAPNPPPCLSNNGLVRTTDGGKSWQDLSLP